MNVAISIDGKISTVARETVALGSAADRRLMDVLRARADAVVVGSGTVQLDGWAIRVRHADLRARRRQRTGVSHPLNVVLSTCLDLRTRCQFFEAKDTDKLIVTTREAPASRRQRFERLAELEILRTKRIRPQAVIDRLATRGMRRILLEGGGELNFSFLRAGLIDDIYITITPRVLGGAEAPTPFDGPGLRWADHVRLDLRSCRRRGQEVFLRYAVRR